MTPLDLPFLSELIALRRDLHAHPEIAFHENRTADLVAAELARYGLTVTRGLAKTGVIGVLKNGSSQRAIALRADMDALPLTEQNAFEHASRHAGCMHACGHDGHTAMLLGAARYLARHRNFDGTLVFIFQPAEEAEGGARVMIEEGLFERFPVDAVFGLHNWPELPLGEMAIRTGPVMASTNRFEIVVRGQGGHAAMPHRATDVIVASAQLVTALQTVVARRLSPVTAAVVSVTQMHAGSAWNVLPAAATLSGTIRTFEETTQDSVEAAIRQLAASVTAHGCTAEVKFTRCYPATVNAEEETRICQAVATELLGADKVKTEPPSLAAEDFSFMLQKKPGCYVWLGNGGKNSAGLHSPHYDFNDAALPIGVSYWVKLAERALDNSNDDM